jgi:integrase
MIATQQFHVVRRPEGVASRYTFVVVDGKGLPHLPLTTFSHKIHQYADGTARTYLNALMPYFTYLATDPWRLRRKDSWESDPEAVRESVRDYLVEQLHCKAQPKETYQLVSLTGKSPSTVRIFLSALKQFYSIARRLGWYVYPHPLTDSVVQLLWEVETEERRAAGLRPRMPQRSGVEDPEQHFTSDNYFKLVDGEWKPQPIDDSKLHETLRKGFKKVPFCLRDQIVVRIAYESGARIREILRLTVVDWRKLGGNQEAWAFSKGSHGRRVKKIRFSSETARMLHTYVNTERAKVDQQHRRLPALDDAAPLFLSGRGNPFDYDTFKKRWYKLCRALGVDLNIHALRHWYVTQEIRLISETAKEPGDIERGKEDLVRYMAWRSPETLKAYEHYFDEVRHATIQTQLHRKWYDEDHQYEQAYKETATLPSPTPVPSLSPDSSSLPSECEPAGWDAFLELGGAVHA